MKNESRDEGKDDIQGPMATILVEVPLTIHEKSKPQFEEFLILTRGWPNLLPQGRVLTTPGGGVTTTPKRTSSSKGNLKNAKQYPHVVNIAPEARVDDPGPRATGVTTGGCT